MYGELPAIQKPDGESVNAFPVVIRRPPKTAALRLPTYPEMFEYLGKQRLKYKDLGRGESSTEVVPTPEADRVLFSALRLDSGAEFDAAEMAHAINELTKVRVEQPEPEGDTAFRITLDTRFGRTVHVIEMPLHKDLEIYRRDLVKSRDLPYGWEERRLPPGVPCDLYDKCIRSVEGYAPGYLNSLTDVPPHHKRSVANALVTAFTALDDPTSDPNL